MPDQLIGHMLSLTEKTNYLNPPNLLVMTSNATAALLWRSTAATPYTYFYTAPRRSFSGSEEIGTEPDATFAPMLAAAILYIMLNKDIAFNPGLAQSIVEKYMTRLEE